MSKLRVGDEVVYRGGFGTEEPQTVTVTAIVICPDEYNKQGEEVLEIDGKKVRDANMIYDLSNNRWCRGHQIDMWKSTKNQ